MEFSWDNAEEEANIRQHGVDFEAAAKVFAEPLCLIQEDRVVEREQRWHATGWAGSILILLVVHTVETETEWEVHSFLARRVTRHERKRYESRTH